MSTLATPANMRAAALRGNAARVVAVSLDLLDEEYSATAGDYWNHRDDEPLRDSDGTPMVLAYRVCTLRDALTDDDIFATLED